MGLLDRFKGKKKSQPEAQEPKQETPEEPGVEEAEAPESAEQRDMTDQWVPEAQAPAGPDERFTGAAGTIKPLTHSAPVETEAPAELTPPSEPAPARAREVKPVSEEEIDRLTVQAMKGHSSRDLEALWDALLSKKQLLVLQRGRGLKNQAHVIESPLGPTLLLFTDRFRFRALTATKSFRNSPIVWRVATMPTPDAIGWILEQYSKGIRAIEFNRSERAGLASVLQSLPARYERVYGVRPNNAHLVDPDFVALSHRAKISGSGEAQRELLDAFFSLQRWYALRDPARPNQPGFTPVDDKPTLMLFTRESEARATAEASGRKRELPKAIMSLAPSKIATWMAKLPGMGVEHAIVNASSASFLIALEGIDQRIAGADQTAPDDS